MNRSRVSRIRYAALTVIALVAACASPTATAGPAPSPSVSPSASPSPSPAGKYAGKIPAFPPRPEPIRPVLPGGPTAPLLSRVPTTQPVAFITIDDGHVQHPEAVALLKEAGVPVSLFLIGPVAAKNPPFFSALQRDGAAIQAHSMTHPQLPGLSYERQKQEICGSADDLGKRFGKRPTLFRPPFGEYNQTTLRAARDCGMTAVLNWKAATNGGHVYYQQGKKLKAGDIVLMHFRPAFVADFLAVLKAIHDAGLTPAVLEDYVG